MNIHKQNLSAKSYYINCFGKLSTSFLFWQIQEIAWEHAEKLGFGFDKLQQQNRFWVLSRLLVKINRRPIWGEKFTVETWPVGIDGLLALRDILFSDTNGEPLIEATTSWLILDADTKRIVRPESLEFDAINYPNKRVFDRFAAKVKPVKAQQNPDFSPVLFNEIDVNQHFNSGRYLERIIDSYDFDFHRKNELIEFEINFAKEGIETDNLAVRKQIIDNENHLCSVVRKSDLSELIRARLVWKSR
jgi:acyl-ACP thioesterase